MRFKSLYPSIVIFFGFAIRLYRLGADSLWYDETVSAFLAAQAIPDLVAHTARDIHPPAYYLLLRFWTLLAGDTEFALAYFSLIFGVLLIALTYRLAGEITGRGDVAFWAAFLVTFSPYNVWYSQEVRMYTLGAFLGLAATWFVLKAWTAEQNQGWFWFGYVCCAVAGLYTLYYFAFLLIVLNLFLFLAAFPRSKEVVKSRSEAPPVRIWQSLTRKNTGHLALLIIANGLIIVAYLPWLPIAWRQATSPPVPPWRTPQSFVAILLESWSALSLGQSVEPVQVWPLLLLALTLFILGLVFIGSMPTSTPSSNPSTSPFVTLRVRKPPGTSLPISSGPLSARAAVLLLYTFGPLLLIQLFSLITPLYHVRYIFTYAPPFYIVLGAGLAWLSHRYHLGAAFIAVILLLAASLFSLYQYHFDPRYRADDFRAAVDFVENHWQPSDVILINAGYTYPAFLYYADTANLERQRLVPYQPPVAPKQLLLLQTGTVDGPDRLGWGDPCSDFYAMSAADTIAALEKISGDYSRLWMLRVYDTVTDPQGLIRDWLDEHTTPIEDQGFAGESYIRAQGFLLDKLPTLGGETVYFEDGMALAGWNFPGQTWRVGQTIQLELGWLTTAPASVDYKMSLKLWSESGELAAQGQDTWPVGTLYRATAWPANRIIYQPAQLKLPDDLPPARYWLNVELYHPETGLPLPRLDGADPVVTLGPVEVE